MKDEIRDRLGFYLVGWKKFFNKTLALIESKKTGYDLKWVFNENIYKNIDWTVPISTPLSELYKKRAEQLRYQYDYVILQFSGGADSSNILHAFIDNKIFLDEIVLQVPETDKTNWNTYDLTSRNMNAEIEFEAKVRLDKYRNIIDPRTVIRYQDYSKPIIEFLNSEYWFEKIPTGVNNCISGIGRQIAQVTDTDLLKLAYKGKTACIVQGVDKPLIYFNGSEYYCFFSDLSAMHNAPIEINHSDIFDNFCRTEFFYWTPSMPEIVIKQAQEIKKNCEINHSIREIFRNSFKTHIKHYKNILHPIIYPAHTEPDFQTDKPSFNIKRDIDVWFWKTASEAQKNNYLKLVEHLGNVIDHDKFIDGDIMLGMAANYSSFYRI